METYKTLEDGWQAFEGYVLKGGDDSEGAMTPRDLFYTGAMVALRMITGPREEGRPPNQEEIAATLSAMHKEAEAFSVSIALRKEQEAQKRAPKWRGISGVKA